MGLGMRSSVDGGGSGPLEASDLLLSHSLWSGGAIHFKRLIRPVEPGGSKCG